MAVEEFSVQNVKCGGCVKAIQDGLGELPGIDSVEVTIDGGQVKVEGEALSRETLSTKLSELGYPEA